MKNDNIGYTDTAVLLADQIMRTSGKKPYLGTFDSSASNQIVITSAAAAATYLPEGVTITGTQYLIFRNGGNIFVVGNDEMGAGLGAQVISQAIQTANGSVDLTSLLTNGAVSYTLGQDHLALDADAEYRIMTYNIARVETAGEGRYENTLNTIGYYNPDVIGFQEFCENYTADFAPMLQAQGYSFVAGEVVIREGYADGAARYDMNNNYTPIAYKTDKFTVLDSGWDRLIPANYNSYGWPGYTVTWAVLRDKATGEVFAVSSLHDLTSNDEAGQAAKKAGLQLVINIVREQIVAQYDCPVFCIGDFNSNEVKEEYQYLASQPDFNDARYIAERSYAIGNTHADELGVLEIKGSTNSCIDHIFAVGQARVLRHRYGHTTISAAASDHKPVFVDVAIGETSGQINTAKVFTSVDYTHVNMGVTQ